MVGEANTKCSSTWHKRAGSQREVLYAMAVKRGKSSAPKQRLVSHYWEVKEETNMSAVECRDETPSEKLDIVHGLEVYG